MIAVRRAEMGDPQPHPCFCLTTVGFWREIGGDWHSGHKWQNEAGNKVSDVGGNLLGKLEHEGIGWRALERTNKTDLHPLFFAVYGDLAYHHGGGFREPRGGRLLNAERGLHEARESRPRPDARRACPRPASPARSAGATTRPARSTSSFAPRRRL